MTRKVQLMMGLSVNETFKECMGCCDIALIVEVQQDRGKVGRVEGSVIFYDCSPIS